MSIIHRRYERRRPTLDEWRRAVPDLKQVGGEWHAACPACGGVDRFWVKPGRAHDAIAFCRHGCDFTALLESAGLQEARRDVRPQARYPHPRKSKQARFAQSNTSRRGISPQPYAPPADDTARRIANAGAIWNASIPADDTPAAVYLREHRRVWPAGAGFPEAVRWLPKPQGPRWTQVGNAAMPTAATGALVFRFIDTAGNLSAVSLDALDGAGTRPCAAQMPGARWRKAIGVCKGAAAVMGKHGGAPIVVVEGEVSALAAVVLAGADAQVMASGGANFLPALIPMLSKANRPVEVWSDNDAPGRAAAMRLVDGLRRAGVVADVKYDFITAARGSDAADYLGEVSPQTQTQP